MLQMLACNCKENSKKHGKDKNGNQRYRCKNCGKSWIDQESKPLVNLRTDLKTAEFVLKCLLEGMSIRATVRLTDVSKNAIQRIIQVAGIRCKEFMEKVVVDQPVKDVECDEIWNFIGCKERHIKEKGISDIGIGDCYNYYGMERHTKFILAWECGKRSSDTTEAFVEKLGRACSRSGRYQVSTDGYGPYGTTVWRHMSPESSHGMIVKMFQSTGKGGRYSPGTITAIKKMNIYGNVDESRTSTSIIERANVTLRMQVRRMTRLTNAHSKKWENHESMMAIYFAWYNWCRKHETLKGDTPAMAQGLAPKHWTISELLLKATSA